MPQEQREPSDATWWQEIWQWSERHGELLGWLFVGSLASLVLCILLLPVIVRRLPADYFATTRCDAGSSSPAVLGWLWRFAKNVLGWLFVLVGVALLVLPGQGLLTILIGLLLVDFPGKRRLERRIVKRDVILRLLNSMRTRKGIAPLIVD